MSHPQREKGDRAEGGAPTEVASFAVGAALLQRSATVLLQLFAILHPEAAILTALRRIPCVKALLVPLFALDRPDQVALFQLARHYLHTLGYLFDLLHLHPRFSFFDFTSGGSVFYGYAGSCITCLSNHSALPALIQINNLTTGDTLSILARCF
jgi:hypothetical protein